MMKHKVGDKVKIRPDLKNHRKYDRQFVKDEMILFCGDQVTISKVIEYENSYEIKEDYGRNRWTDTMLEDAMTNADRIRNMSDESMSLFLKGVLSNHYGCGNLELKCKEDEVCSNCTSFLDWLKVTQNN